MEIANKYKYSKAYYKILDLIVSNPKETVFVICGGQGAGKTISIIELIIQSLISSEKEATVLSGELSKMKKTVVRDYKKIAKDWNIIKEETDFNRSESKQEYSNGSYIDFLGADVNDVGKGFRRDLLYINEADKLEVDTAVQFISRAGLTIIDYNPDRRFWGNDYVNANNFIVLTFEDNEYLPISERNSILDYKVKGFFNPELPFTELFQDENIKNKYWANKWRVYGLGLVGSLDGIIFENYEEMHAIPADATLEGYGLDFGFANDPASMVAVYKWNGTVIVKQLIYKTGLVNAALIDIMNSIGVDKQKWIIADSADPKSIEDISRAGFTIKKCYKGNDHKNYAIQSLQTFDTWYVTSDSKDMIHELGDYLWAKDRSGEKTNKPEDGNDHAMDALIYFVNELFNLRGETKNSAHGKPKVARRITSNSKHMGRRVGR